MKKPDFIFTFQNSCSNVAVATFTPSDNGGKQAFTVTGYDLDDYFDVGDDMAFTYSSNYYVYTIVDITGNQITMSFDYNASITNVNTTLQFSIKTTANPLNFLSGKFQWDKDKENYFMKMKYSGKVLFGKPDYDYLYNALNDQCCNVLFKVYKLCDNEYSLFYKSNITRFEGTWNETRCTFESDLPPFDKYSCIISNSDETINLYESDRGQIAYYQDDFRGLASGQGPFYEYLVRATVPVAPSDVYTPASGADFQQLQGDGGYAVDPNTGNPWTIYARELKIVTYTGDPLSFVAPIISGYTITPPEIRQNGKIIVRYTKAIIPGDEPNFTQLDEVYGTGGVCESKEEMPLAIYDPVNDNCIYVTTPRTGSASFFSAVRLDDSLTLLAFRCNNIQGITSDFFEINPIGDTPGYVAGDNYVTGFQNYVNNLWLTQITSVTINGSQAPERLDYSFKKLMTDLRYMFNVYWFIDDQYRLRIEHDSWFIGNTIVDVSTAFYNRGFNTYTYIKEDTPNKEKFLFKYGFWIDFVGADIVYSDVCTDKPVALTRQSEMSTDIHYLRNTPDSISSDGIVMMATNGAFVYYEIGILSQVSLQNNHLSWANLHENYHYYGRIIETGLMNYVLTNFTTWKKRKRQVNQKYIGCCLTIPENQGQVITELGTGDAIKIVYDINSNTWEFELNQP